MKFLKNALINAYFDDYAALVHTNESAEIQQIKLFPIYEFNELEVNTAIQKLNSETRTLYNIDVSRTYFHASKFCLQPKLIVNNGLTKKFLKTISFNEKEEEIINFDVSEHSSLTCIFSQTEHNGHQAKVFNTNAKILQTITQYLADGMYVHVMQKNLEIIIKKDNQIQFYNSFQYKSANDFCYFVTNVLNTMYDNENNAKLQVFGRIMESSELINQLKKFVPDVEMLNMEQADWAKVSPVSQNFATLALITV